MEDGLRFRYDERIERALSQLHVPGCALALIENRRVTLLRAYGLADLERAVPVTTETLFSVQSVSKSFAAWAVMRLVEAGKVELDSPVSRYIRRWSLPPSDKYDLNLVTPRRLLSHHAGITNIGFRGVEPGQSRYTVVDALQAGLPPPNEEQIRYYEDWKLEHDKPVCLDFPPGESWHYSNAGFGILELMIEDLTGIDYGDFVTNEILKPLGMEDSSFQHLPNKRYAVPYSKHGDRCIDYVWPSRAAAGLYASIADLAKFACAEMVGPNGEPPGRGVLSPASITTMFTANGLADNAGGTQFEAGLGHLLLTSGGPMNVHHSGGSVGWRSIFSIFPETGAGICMLMNGEGANDMWIPLVREWRTAQPTD